MSTDLYQSITRDEVARAISELGHEVTFVVAGDIGSGKSTLLNDLRKMHPKHRPVYFDMTRFVDSGDFQLPAADHATRTSDFYPNVGFGLHEGVPAIIMYDEIGKANTNVLNAIMTTLIEHRWGNKPLHRESIVFGTTNLGSENLGDSLEAHHRNRITLLRMEKPSAVHWIPWAVSAGLHPIVIEWVAYNPQCFASFEDVPDPETNAFIYHPKAYRAAFVTHRSMAQASKLMYKREILGDKALTHLLIGTIGAPAALSLMAYARMGNEIPTSQQIIAEPTKTPVPKSQAGMILLSCQALSWVTPETLGRWLTYMDRFTFKEAKALFGIQATTNPSAAWMLQNDEFQKFAMDNNYMFGG